MYREPTVTGRKSELKSTFWIITLSKIKEERILKAIREKETVTYQGVP